MIHFCQFVQMVFTNVWPALLNMKNANLLENKGGEGALCKFLQYQQLQLTKSLAFDLEPSHFLALLLFHSHVNLLTSCHGGQERASKQKLRTVGKRTNASGERIKQENERKRVK